MPAVFEHTLTVRADEIDELGHVNNIEYLRWMQTAAVKHSDRQGWTTEDYKRLGLCWVVRSHFIEYLQPAFSGEDILVRTWVCDMKKVTSARRFEIIRPGDSTLLVRATTNWAFIDFETRTLARIPLDVSQSFEIVPDTR